MKQRITLEDISTLTDKQKQNLTALWMPALYDIAIASICKDITNDEYETYEFAVGKIQIVNGYHILLDDIRALGQDSKPGDTENYCDTDNDSSDDELSAFDDETEDRAEGDYTDDGDEEIEEFDMDYSFTLPTSFAKEECLPLLSIGQMIDILQKNNFGNSSVYLSVFVDEKGCEIGKDTISMEDYQKGYEETELCDALWESVKKLL